MTRYAQGAGIDEPLAESRGGTAGFYEQDGLGSVTSLSGASGTFGNTYAYDSFGVLTASTGTLGNPFQYAGRDYDSETGLRYYRARYYDPATGRFLSEDPTEFDGGTNFYPYVGNDPIIFVDPYGLQALPKPQTPPSNTPKPFLVPKPQPPIGIWSKFLGFLGDLAETGIGVGGIVLGNPLPLNPGEQEMIDRYKEEMSRRRGNSDPIPNPGVFDPGREPCKDGEKQGRCKPCPPDTPYWKQRGNVHGGTLGWHTHWYHWNQDPKTCKCYPKRMSGGSQP